jgi:hypothetical protein
VWLQSGWRQTRRNPLTEKGVRWYLGGPSHLIFVTSASGTADLSTWAGAGGETGLRAGDAFCRGRAAAVGLPGAQTFVAWLFDSADDAL